MPERCTRSWLPSRPISEGSCARRDDRGRKCCRPRPLCRERQGLPAPSARDDRRLRSRRLTLPAAGTAARGRGAQEPRLSRTQASTIVKPAQTLTSPYFNASWRYAWIPNRGTVGVGHLPADVVLDGEAVAPFPRGFPDFYALRTPERA